MNKTERSVALRNCVNNDTHCEEIINLINRLVLIDHLFINRKIVFDAAFDLIVLNADFLESFPAFQNNVVDKCLPLGLSRIHLLNKSEIYVRLQISEREVVHLRLDLGNTEPTGDR